MHELFHVAPQWSLADKLERGLGLCSMEQDHCPDSRDVILLRDEPGHHDHTARHGFGSEGKALDVDPVSYDPVPLRRAYARGPTNIAFESRYGDDCSAPSGSTPLDVQISIPSDSVESPERPPVRGEDAR
jgi:hypothetical protein